MKILIYGAGVLGSLFAVRLHAAGQAVTLLARGQRLADLREHGVVLQDAESGVRTAAQVPLTDALRPEDVYDLIVVIMRKNQVADVLPVLAANATPNILFLGNNVTGADAYVDAVGRARVLLGFAAAGGLREGYVVRYLASDEGPGLTFGELDGSVSERAQQIAAAFQSAGITPTLSPDIDAWLKTHWAIVGPLAGAVYACQGDVYQVARTRDARVLIVRAIREGLRVLRDQGIPILPGGARLIEVVPETVLIALLARLAASERAEVAVAGHANAARDEMAALTEEFRALKHRGQVWTPALDRLALYMDPAMPVLPEGAATLPLSWQGTFAMLVGALVVFNVLSNIGSYLLGLATGRRRRA